MNQHAWPDRAIPFHSAWSKALSRLSFRNYSKGKGGKNGVLRMGERAKPLNVR